MSLRILIVTPAPAGSRVGNRITALRWRRLLAGQGHDARVATEYVGRPCDVLVALHAVKSAASVRRYREERPAAPLVLALTGTDVYGDIHAEEAVGSLEAASRIVVLQPLAARQLPDALRDRVRVIHQSVEAPRRLPARRASAFDVIVAGHLRAVKDPFRTAEAARLLPAYSRVRVWHVGAALSGEMETQARAEMAANPRYVWLGERTRTRTLRLLARARLLSLTSVSEGGANVISEACAVGTPVVSSRIDGSAGLLGEGHPGYFPVGDTAALAALLHRAETDADWLEALRQSGERLRPLVTPAEESRRWAALLAEIVPRLTPP